MQRKHLYFYMPVIILLLGLQPSYAEVVSASNSHFTLLIKENSTLSVEQVWQKLIHPKVWWHPDHTYCGDANNLTLEAIAGGHWREDWSDGSVLHGTVLNIQKHKLLRLNAPFGPLQSMSVSAIWTITMSKTDTGTAIQFEFIATGIDSSQLDKIAPAVNQVKGQAIKRLANTN